MAQATRMGTFLVVSENTVTNERVAQVVIAETDMKAAEAAAFDGSAFRSVVTASRLGDYDPGLAATRLVHRLGDFGTNGITLQVAIDQLTLRNVPKDE